MLAASQASLHATGFTVTRTPPQAPPNTIEADIRSAVYQAAARNGYWETYQHLTDMYRAATGGVCLGGPRWKSVGQRGAPACLMVDAAARRTAHRRPCHCAPSALYHPSWPPPLPPADPAEKERCLLALGYAPGGSNVDATLALALSPDVRAQVGALPRQRQAERMPATAAACMLICKRWSWWTDHRRRPVAWRDP